MKKGAMMIMRKHKWAILITVLVLGAVGVLVICLNSCDFDYKFQFMLYSYVQCNGVIYYRVEDRPSTISSNDGYSREQVAVYVMDDSLNVDYKHPHYINVSEKDPTPLYFLFDSDVWTRDVSLAAKFYHLTPSPSPTVTKSP